MPGNASAYQALLESLIVEGVQMLGLKEAKVRARAADKAVVMAAISKVGPTTGAAVTLDETVDLKLDKSVVNIEKECIGGVQVCSTDGKIVVSQTLNSRLQVAYDTASPCTKPLLFNQQGSKHTDTF